MKTASIKILPVSVKKDQNRLSGLNKWFVGSKSALFWASIPVYFRFLTRILGNIYVRAPIKHNGCVKQR
jgi:hypothetical protein